MTIVINTPMTSAQFEARLKSEVAATLLGTSDRTFYLTDNIEINNVDVEIHGHRLVFESTFGIYSTGASAVVRAGWLENGSIREPVHITGTGDVLGDDNTVDEANSIVRAGSKWLAYGLTFVHDNTPSNDGLQLYSLTSQSVFESFSYEVINSNGSHYLTIGMDPTATVTIQSLRNSNVRLISGQLGFVEGGQGWLRSQGGQAALKMLADDAEFIGFEPRYPSDPGEFQTTGAGFNATTMSFTDSGVLPSTLRGFPRDNDDVIRLNFRNFTFAPIDFDAASISDFAVTIESDQVASASYVGDVSGIKVLHTLTGASPGAVQKVQTFRGYRVNATYGPLLHTLDSSDITCYYYKFGKVLTKFKENSHLWGFQSNARLADDALVTDDEATVGTYTGLETAIKVYNYQALWKKTNLGVPTLDTMVVGRDASVLLASAYDIDIDATAVSLFDLTGNKLTIKTASYTGGITSTGTIRQLNGATMSDIDLVGATWECQESTPTGSADAASRLVITTATPNQVFDCRGFDFDALTVFENTSGQPIILKLLPAQQAPTELETSGTITLDRLVGVTIANPNIIDDSRCRLYNVTKAIELDNSVVAGGGGYSFAANLGDGTIDSGDQIRLDTTYAVGFSAKLCLRSVGTVTSNGLEFAESQADDLVYNGNMIDGSLVTEIIADYPNVQFDYNDPDGVTDVKRIYAWFAVDQTTADGIRNFFCGIVAQDAENYVIDTAVADITFENINANPLKILGRIVRSDGVTVIAPGNNSIQMDPGRAFIADSTHIHAQLDAMNAVEPGVDSAGAMRLLLSGILGLLSGATTTEDEDTLEFRDLNDTKTRILGVADKAGNRTFMSYDVSPAIDPGSIGDWDGTDFDSNDFETGE